MPIPFVKLSVENLARAIVSMVENAGMQRKAVDLRDVMAAEKGIARAVEIIQHSVP